MGDRDTSNNIMDCVLDMDSMEEEGVFEHGGEKDVIDVNTCPAPILTVEKVLETFRRISSIKTPDINAKLAIPYQKEPVKSSTKFKEEYSDVKNNLRKISGGLGKEVYHAEKERRKSAPFSWPKPSPTNQGSMNLVAGGSGGDSLCYGILSFFL